MGYREPDAEDPLEFRAVAMPGEPGDMLRTLVEEYALMGMKADRILALFRTPFFRGGHLLYAELGEDAVREAIRSVFGGQGDQVADAGPRG